MEVLVFTREFCSYLTFVVLVIRITKTMFDGVEFIFRDMKGIVKVVNGILILQNGHSDAWTGDLQIQMANWTGQYVQWLQMNPLGIQESRTQEYVLVSICPPIPSISFLRPLSCAVQADR